MATRAASSPIRFLLRRAPFGWGPPPWLGRGLRLGLGVGVLGACALLGFTAWVQVRTAPLIYTSQAPDLPAHHVALVFGAGLDGQGGPSAVLYDRVVTAAGLYHTGKVQKLLMSGDNSTADYNEVGVMRRTAEQLGVAPADIVLDYAGLRTYDSCYRAGAVFGLHAATLVTNRFHLPRALYTCQALGLSVVGVIADRRPYQGTTYWTAREVAALPVAWWWVHVDHQPAFLGPLVDVDDPPYQP